MYQSPIGIIQKELATRYENGVLKAVQDFGFIVDAGELTKALMFDRNQYEKGYKDRDSEIIRCKDCKYFREGIYNTEYWMECSRFRIALSSDEWFCGDAERRTE